ncbi:MAG: hypothetical protein JW981_04820, partial [Anaerolineae bacterium]|nr:hypothetical protein [Anaerolineae bacterium]
MDTDVKQAQQRAYRYWYTDGLAEILGGVTFVIVGVLIYIKDLLFQSLLASVITIAFLLLLAVGVRILIRVLKERLTYPRTGYVAYRKRKVNTLWIRLVLGLTLGAVVS